MRWTCVWVLLVVSLSGESRAQELALLRPGEAVEGVLEDGGSEVETDGLLSGRYTSEAPALEKTYQLMVPKFGIYHIDVRSHFFDPYVVLSLEDGTPLNMNDDGLLGTHARLIAELQPSLTYTITVRSQNEYGGAFEARVGDGEPALLAPQARYEAELHDAEERVAARAGSLGLSHWRTATAINDIGFLLIERGRFEDALQYFDKAVSLMDSAQDVPELELAAAQGNLGLVLESLGRLREAKPYTETALGTWERVGGPPTRNAIVARANYAMLLARMGEGREAREQFELVLSTAEMADALAPTEIARVKSSFASMLHKSGELPRARVLLEEALTAHLAQGLQDSPGVAATKNNLGALEKDLGNFDSAQALLEDALRILQETRHPDDLEIVQVRNTYGLLLLAQEQDDAARAVFAEALASLSRRSQHASPMGALVKNNLASALFDLGESEEALKLYEEVLLWRQQGLPRGHPDTAGTLASIAHVLSRRGRYEEAHSNASRATAMLVDVFGFGHPKVEASVHNEALWLLDDGKASDALAVTQHSATPAALQLRLLASLTEDEAFRRLALTRWRLDVRINASIRVGDAAQGYATVLSHKGLVGRLTTQTRRQALESLPDEARAVCEELLELESQLTLLVYQTSVRDKAAHRALVDDVRKRRDAMDRRLRDFAGPLRVRETTVRDVAEVLPEGAALVDLLVHRVRLAPTINDAGALTRPAGWAAESHLSAWIVRSVHDSSAEVVATHVDLGPVGRIEAAALSHLDEIRGETALDGLASGAMFLRQLVWDPLVPYLEGAQVIHLAPDGILTLVPWETIVDHDGAFLIERYAFTYPSDGAALAGSRGAASSLRDGDLTALIVGGVSYEERDRTATERLAQDVSSANEAVERPLDDLRARVGTNWAPLQGTVEEAGAVRSILQNARGDDEVRVSILRGAAATESAVKLRSSQNRILHLATHGFFEPEGLPSVWRAASGATESELASGGVLEMPKRQLGGLSPGLLSGLVLAGANAEPDPDDFDDGYLTASEVSALNLARTDLVVLSACETGLGRPEAGEGLLGLRRAFQIAGANTVVSSLWRVPDKSTAELMKLFYSNLLEHGMGRSDALREAKLEMIESNRRSFGGDARPETWGAFVLSGEWR